MATVTALIQATAVTAAIAISLFQPKRQERRTAFRNLIAYRNIAYFAVRMLPDIEGCDFANESSTVVTRLTLERCVKRVQDIPVMDVVPPHLSEQFVNIDITASRSLLHMQQDDCDKHLEVYKLSAIQADRALKVIDAYLVENDAKLEPNGTFTL
ncbi:MAG: hypothetical protein JHD32_04560 [Sphingobium sp.]|nr:hypothetical protein [Sphingobium sp.]